MKILVTGSKGFIGQNLVWYLAKQGHTVAEYDYIPNVIPDCSPFDKVIHMGAISSTTERDVEKVLQQNLDFSYKLLQVCDMQGVDLIYASSASVYGDTGKFLENGKLYPLNPYAWSKYLFDRGIEMIPWVDYKCTIQGFRFFNVYGKHEEHKGSQMSVFHHFKKQAIETGKVHPFENSENYKRDFICVEDVCKIIEKFLTIDQSGIWNLGTGTATSFRDIADYTAKKYKAVVEPIPMPNNLKSQYQEFTKSDNTKLINTIGEYKFITPFEWIDNDN